MGFTAKVLADSEEEARASYIESREGTVLKNGKVIRNVVVTEATDMGDGKWLLIGTHNVMEV